MARRSVSVLRVAKLAITDFFADDMPTYAAALAYRVLFSLFPFLIFLTALLGFFRMPQLFEWLREQASYVLPEQAMELVNTVLSELQTPQGGLMSFAIAIALWSASSAVVETMNALNVAYDVKERRPGWKRTLVAILYTLGLAVLFGLTAGLMLTGPTVLEWIGQYVGFGSVFITIWTWLRWPLAAFLLMIVAAVVYYAGPNLKQPFRLISPGAVLAVSVWILASVAFGFYVQTFADYNKTYGSMGAVIILLLYLFLSAAVMLFGAEVNAVILRERGEPIEESHSQ